ncbi:MAG: ExbD/TolR family protein [Pseudobdellovibrionaceae bacterium]
MSIDFSSNKKRKILVLQLAPMIDVFVLIIVFLLKATVLGGVSIVIPSDMKSAKSSSKESVEAAPQVIIHENKVELAFLNKKIDIKAFDSSNSTIDQLKSDLKSYIDKTSNQAKSSVVNLNIVADSRTPYRQVFDVIKVFREAGLQSMLFIAEGEKK